GMAEERLAEINRDLASLPAFDLASSDRLGLFIAGRLAHRHDIKIALRSSVYGGTTAVVIIPKSLVVTDDGPGPAAATARRPPPRGPRGAAAMGPPTAGTRRGHRCRCGRRGGRPARAPIHAPRGTPSAARSRPSRSRRGRR